MRRLIITETVQPLTWQPATDVYRTREGWLVKVELAGVRAEDIEITVGGRRLQVRGTRCDREIMEGCEFYSLEIAYSQFDRAIELPADLDHARILTSYRDGMLLVRVLVDEATP
jgi:HSP20 family protein